MWGGEGYIDVACEFRCTYSSAVRGEYSNPPPPIVPFPLLEAKRVGVAWMTTECWLVLLMGSDGSSTLWGGSWVSLTVVVRVLAPKTTVGEKPRRVMMIIAFIITLGEIM